MRHWKVSFKDAENGIRTTKYPVQNRHRHFPTRQQSMSHAAVRTHPTYRKGFVTPQKRLYHTAKEPFPTYRKASLTKRKCSQRVAKNIIHWHSTIYTKVRKSLFFRAEQTVMENNEPVRGTLSIFFTVRIKHRQPARHVVRETQNFASLQANAIVIIWRKPYFPVANQQSRDAKSCVSQAKMRNIQTA